MRSERWRWENGGIFTGLVLRVALVVAVAVVVMNDGGQIMRAQVKAQSAARAAAVQAATLFRSTHNRAEAAAGASEAATQADAGAKVTMISYAPDGTAEVTVADTARTLIAQHVSFLRKFTVQNATESEGPS